MEQRRVTVYRQELSPTHFLERSGTVHADRVAVMDGEVSYTWRHFRARSPRLASALRATGIQKGDRIAFLALKPTKMVARVPRFGRCLGQAELGVILGPRHRLGILKHVFADSRSIQ